MSWTAKLLQTTKDIETNTIRVDVGITDGVTTIDKAYFVTNPNSTSPAWVKNQVREDINKLSSTDSAIFPIGDIDLTPPPQGPGLTQAEIDRQTFISDYKQWIKIKTLIDSGILTGSEAKVVQLKNKVITEFKPEYLDFI